MTKPDRLLILAGNATQAAQYCREHDIPLSEARWVMSADQIRGYHDPEYVVTGTFWNNPQAIPIWQALCSVCKRTTPQAPPEIEPFLHKNFPVFSPAAPVTPPPAPPEPEPELAPLEFKHIEDVPSPKKTFKRIKP